MSGANVRPLKRSLDFFYVRNVKISDYYGYFDIKIYEFPIQM